VTERGNFKPLKLLDMKEKMDNQERFEIFLIAGGILIISLIFILAGIACGC